MKTIDELMDFSNGYTLDGEGTERIYADPKKHVGAVYLDFNPDEPRDDHGQWTSGGGSSSSSSAPGPAAVTVYHGTISSYVDGIKRDGLVVHSPTGRNFDSMGENEGLYAGDRGESVYVSKSYMLAEEWAAETAQRRNGRPVVLQFTVPPSEAHRFLHDELGNPEDVKVHHGLSGKYLDGYWVVADERYFVSTKKKALEEDVTIYVGVVIDPAAGKDFDPSEPRDDHGRWTSGGGGPTAGSSGEDPHNDNQYLHSDGKYHVEGDVEAAARLISQDKDVVLDQPRELSTLLDRLAAMGKEGDKVYDLCHVSVTNTNLFCAESKGYKRVEMPQLSGKPTPGSVADSLPHDKAGGVDATPLFVARLQSEGHSVKEGREDAAYLRASQRELDGVKVARMMKAIQAGTVPEESIIISRDNYIVDGHHRWAAKVALEYASSTKIEMPVRRVDMDIVTLLHRSNDFATEIGIPQRGVGKFFNPCVVGAVYLDFNPDEPRDDHGRWTSGGAGAGPAAGSDTGGMEMVSPSVAQGLTLEQAVHELASPRQREVMDEAAKVDGILGLQAHQDAAIGAWADGAENSIMVTVTGSPTFDQLRTSAAMKGMLADQKAVIPFRVEKGGPDAMYRFDAPTTDIGALHGDLGKLGVEYHTLEPHAEHTTVWVFDQGSKLEPTMEKVGAHYGRTIHKDSGRGEFLGSWDSRDEGRTAYQAVIDANLGRDERARWDGLYNRWRETHPLVKGFRQAIVALIGAFLPGVLKYDPDEPRDERGRWTSGGGADVLGEPKNRDRVTAQGRESLAKEGLPPEKMSANAMEFMDSGMADQTVQKEGKVWYHDENDLARDIAAQGPDGMTTNQAAAMLAATSPQVPVERARVDARSAAIAVAEDGTVTVTKDRIEGRYQAQLLVASREKNAELAAAMRSKARADHARWTREDLGKTYNVRTGDPDKVAEWHPLRAGAMTDGWGKAIRIARGEDPDKVLNGFKVRSFWNNIAHPGSSDAVTIDGWMAKAIAGNPKLKASQLQHLIGSRGRYEAFSQAVRAAADKYHVAPHQAQAVIWIAYRKKYG